RERLPGPVDRREPPDRRVVAAAPGATERSGRAVRALSRVGRAAAPAGGDTLRRPAEAPRSRARPRDAAADSAARRAVGRTLAAGRPARLRQAAGGQRRRDRDRHGRAERPPRDRKSTRLNSSHVKISYAVFCLKKKK